MKEKIFNKMIEYGWDLGDFDKNGNYDKGLYFDNVYNIHYDFINDLYEYFLEKDEKNESCDLNDINEQSLRDFTDFISDFLRAINDIEKEK